VAYYLLDTNRYKKNKAFFNALTSWISSLKQYYAGINDSFLIAFAYLENTLSEVSTDFNISMAKSLLK